MILITGGAGYIGSHTIIDLQQDSNHNCISCDCFFNSTPQTFNRIQSITNKSVQNYNVDLTDFERTKKIFEENNITGVIHFAAFKAVGESVEFPLKYYKNNLESLTNLLALCNTFGVNNFIFSSSCTVYGEPKKLPVSESSPIQPATSPYGNTKQIGEAILKDFCAINPQFNAIALRYFNPVGAHPSGTIGELPNGVPNNLVPFITQTAIGKRAELTVFGGDYDTKDGSCVRDYIHVCDIAKAHTLAIARLIRQENKQNFEVFNLGTGNGVSVLESIQSFEKVAQQKLAYKIGPRRAGDVIATYANRDKAEKILKWTPKYNLDDMMLSAWKWEQFLQEKE